MRDILAAHGHPNLEPRALRDNSGRIPLLTLFGR